MYSDGAAYDCFARDSYPWPVPSEARNKLHTVADTLLISPLPVYDVETKELMLPGEYTKLKGALVCVHFTIAYNQIGKTDAAKKTTAKHVFSAEVKRIEYIDKMLDINPASPSKKRRKEAPSAGASGSGASGGGASGGGSALAAA